MDEVTLVKTKFRQEQWEKLISACQNSKLKVDDWCSLNNISRHAYYYWLRKIRKQACRSIPEAETEAAPVQFAKLPIDMEASGKTAAVVIHLHAATVEIKEGASRQTVETVLLALKAIC